MNRDEFFEYLSIGKIVTTVRIHYELFNDDFPIFMFYLDDDYKYNKHKTFLEVSNLLQIPYRTFKWNMRRLRVLNLLDYSLESRTGILVKINYQKIVDDLKLTKKERKLESKKLLINTNQIYNFIYEIIPYNDLTDDEKIYISSKNLENLKKLSSQKLKELLRNDA